MELLTFVNYTDTLGNYNKDIVITSQESYYLQISRIVTYSDANSRI